MLPEDWDDEMRIYYFHTLLRDEALQTFKSIQRNRTTTLEDVLRIFRRKYVRPESQASAKVRWHKMNFDPNEKKFAEFLEELEEAGKKAFGESATEMAEQFLYSKMQPHLKKSINTAFLENGTYKQMVDHIYREMDLNGLENCEDELPVTTMAVTKVKNENKPKKRQMPQTQSNVVPEATKGPCRYCKEYGHELDDCAKLAAKIKRDEKNGIVRPTCSKCNKVGHTSERCLTLRRTEEVNFKS